MCGENYLDGGLSGDAGPSCPIILVKWILNGDNRILLDEFLVQGGQLVCREPLGLVGVGVLEVQIVLAFPESVDRKQILKVN